MSDAVKIAARLTRESAASLAKAIEAMPADKQVWKPLDKGRSALSMAQECAVINKWSIDTLTNRSVPELDMAAYEAACNALDTVDAALAALKTNTEALAAVIEAFPAGDLAQTITMPWGSQTYEECLYLSYWNHVYHTGQVNYIQTLYGDMEMHM